GHPILALRFDRERALAVVAEGEQARVIDARTARTLAGPFRHAGNVAAAALAPPLLLTGSSDQTARLWDWASGKALPVLKHDSPVVSVAFSPDGRLAATGTLAGQARVWDVTTGQPRGDALEHPHLVASLAFSPDGRHLATGSADNAVRTWDVSTGQP